MLPKKGKKLHRGALGSGSDLDFIRLIAGALRAELNSTHQAVKTAMRWTGASERTVKHWFAGTHGPSGEHLVALARHSDEVLKVFLVAADRNSMAVAAKVAELRRMLLETIEYIERQS
ncbi:hypothetical protein [Bradyrhizobium sp. AZCC 2289]|uniref:hypothetical protein n=1 Tax=Bradyrhizobium sp. AZCC 2289 TaxID=3117026 RepID=UPI002FEFC2D9